MRINREQQGPTRVAPQVVFACAVLLAIPSGASASAKTYRVNDTSDHIPGKCNAADCTLREAVIAANDHSGNDGIVLSGGKTYKLTQPPTTNEDAALNGDLDIVDSVTISRSGHGRATVDGNHLDAVFQLNDPAAVKFVGIAIRNGTAPAGDSAAGIDRVDHPPLPEGKLSLIDCKVSVNVGPYAGGIANFGPILIRDSEVSSNNGISVSGSGGVEAYDKPATIVHSVIAHNLSGGTGGLYMAGGGTISHSKIEHNHATSGDAGIDGYLALHISNSQIRNNVGSQDGGVYWGGGGPVTISRSKITGNRGDGTAGGLEVGGTTKFTMSRSAVSGNQGTSAGGVYLNLTGPAKITHSSINGNVGTGNVASAGGIESGPLTMTESTVAGNHGGADGGGIYANGRLTIRGSTISGNHAAGAGGGIYREAFDSASVVDSTVAGNRAGTDGGGIWSRGVGQGAFALNGVTIARNTASAGGAGGSGGGIFVYPDPGPVTATNSLIALNQLGLNGADEDCHGVVSSTGNNLRSHADAGCAGFTGLGDLVKSKPKLGPLAHGGPTETVALLRHSPAIGRASKATATKRDQRGIKRDSKPDIGAYERR